MVDQTRPDIEGITNLRKVGAGGYSTVYVGLDEAFQRQVAVKVLHRLDDDGRRRFDRERATMGRLDGHPNVITPYRSGFLADGSAYLMMEYAAQGSLQDQLDNGHTFDWAQAVTYLGPVVEALGAAHAQGILHRDVKPANILLTSDWVPKLTDFGISSLREGTATATLTFTLAHAPPETFDSGVDRRDERSDLYSLASTIYTMVSGRAPFDPPTGSADSHPAYMHRILTQPVPSPLPDPAIVQFLTSALAKDPNHRPPNAAAFRQALSATVAPEHRSAEPWTGPVQPTGGQTTFSVDPRSPDSVLASSGQNPVPPSRAAGGGLRLMLGGIAAVVILAAAVVALRPFDDDRSDSDDLVTGPTTVEQNPDNQTEDSDNQTEGSGPDSGTEQNTENQTEDSGPDSDSDSETETDQSVESTPDPAADLAVAERVAIQTGDISDVWTAGSGASQDDIIADYEAIPACAVTLPTIRGDGETASAGRGVTYSSGSTAFSVSVIFYETEQLASERGPLLTLDLGHQECTRTLLENSILATNPTAGGFATESGALPAAEYGQRTESTQYVITFDLEPLGRSTFFVDEYTIQIGRAVVTIIWSGDIEFDVRQTEIVQIVGSRFEREMAAVGE